MNSKWSEIKNNTGQDISNLLASNPVLAKVNDALDQAMSAHGALDQKTKELIAIAVAVTTRCEGCISIHMQAAVKYGATEEELAETFATAIALNAGAAMVYAGKAVSAFKDFSK